MYNTLIYILILSLNFTTINLSKYNEINKKLIYTNFKMRNPKKNIKKTKIDRFFIIRIHF